MELESSISDDKKVIKDSSCINFQTLGRIDSQSKNNWKQSNKYTEKGR